MVGIRRGVGRSGRAVRSSHSKEIGESGPIHQPPKQQVRSEGLPGDGFYSVRARALFAGGRDIRAGGL